MNSQKTVVKTKDIKISDQTGSHKNQTRNQKRTSDSS